MPLGKSIFTTASALAHVESLHNAFVENRKGYRAELRSILQSSRVLIIQLRNNPDVRSKFRKKIDSMKQKRPSGMPNITLEVMTYVTGDSRAGHQRASKYAGVFEVLDSEGIPAENTAEEIKARGGIEKILRGRRQEATPLGESDDGPSEPLEESAHQTRNDQYVLCGIYMRRSDLDAIRRHSVGTTIVIDALRVGQQKAELQLQRLTFQESGLGKGEDDEDDEE